MSSLKLELSVNHPELSMSELSQLRISVSASNQGKRTIDPGLDNADLLVNAVPSLPFKEAIGNGIREPVWNALPPGQTLTREWPLGEALFAAPGKYILVFRVGSVSAAPVTLTVRSL